MDQKILVLYCVSLVCVLALCIGATESPSAHGGTIDAASLCGCANGQCDYKPSGQKAMTTFERKTERTVTAIAEKTERHHKMAAACKGAAKCSGKLIKCFLPSKSIAALMANGHNRREARREKGCE